MHEAETHLSRLLERVATGEGIGITNRARLVAHLVVPARRIPDFDVDRGRVRIAEDVDDPLPEGRQRAFEGEGWGSSRHARPREGGAPVVPARCGPATGPGGRPAAGVRGERLGAGDRGAPRQALLGSDVGSWSRRVAREPALHHLPVTAEHAAAVEHLPDVHRAPFDRLLVARVRVEGLVLLPADRRLTGYGDVVRVLGDPSTAQRVTA
ncbi:hypothetical protein ACI8AC_20955 [Geodermatophilus sp. SYSU D00758]